MGVNAVLSSVVSQFEFLLSLTWPGVAQGFQGQHPKIFVHPIGPSFDVKKNYPNVPIRSAGFGRAVDMSSDNP